jgi:hypothetical protein
MDTGLRGEVLECRDELSAVFIGPIGVGGNEPEYINSRTCCLMRNELGALYAFGHGKPVDIN